MSWFNELNGADQAIFGPRFVKRSFRRGDTIVFQGDDSASVCLLDAGHAAVKVSTERGESVTVTVIGAGSSFGEIAAVTGERRTATVVALDEVTVRVLPRGTFQELRRRVPEVDAALLRSMAQRIDDLSARLAEAAYETVQRRCEHRLVELAKSFSGDGRRSATIPLTQEDLAGLVGATRPTINQVLGALADERLIAVGRGRVDVPNIDALEAHAR
ncbi:Crp/Fnr family transcriptional regulator [Naasia sp. SYSU D00057]|uniref:Crp/Fnr family transcriptional regulator n=1 Tax=Naasia sp. SYSU D00057 TaxID=2817380 RepID=UPI001B300A62|nr:Crp/Fnr family transcriptional regulator [Naasia sp. SYSU D00057]